MRDARGVVVGRVVGGLAALLWLISPVTSGASEVEPIRIELEPGQIRDVTVDLGRELPYQAEVKRPEAAPWPAEVDRLAVGLVRSEDLGKARRRRPEAPSISLSGRSSELHLRAQAHPCVVPGSYESELRLTSARSVQVPLEITVRGPGRNCDWLTTKAWLLTISIPLFLLLAALYGWHMYLHSRFLSPEQLAQCLRPQRWNERQEAVWHRHRQDDVRSRIRQQLSWRQRIGAWLKANPFRIGLPGGSYEETVRLELPRFPQQPGDLGLTVLPWRSAAEQLEKAPSNGLDGLYAIARNGRVSFLAMADRDGRISRLAPQGWHGRRPGKAVAIGRRFRLLDPDPPADAVDQLAGWEIGRG